MIVGIQGTKAFDDYSVFLRAMGTALSSMSPEDKEFTVYASGVSKINLFAMEFCNVSERGFKSRGIRVKLIKVPPSWIKENFVKIDYFAFFSKPKESLSDLVDFLERKDVSIGVYRY
jgi:hypothetical protein